MLRSSRRERKSFHDWPDLADRLDMLSIDDEARKRLVRVLGQIEARE